MCKMLRIPPSFIPPSHRPGAVCFEERIEHCCASLRHELHRLNANVQQSIQDLIHSAVNNLAADIRYQFLEAHGPKRKEVTPTNPLTQRWVHPLHCVSPVAMQTVIMVTVVVQSIVASTPSSPLSQKHWVYYTRSVSGTKVIRLLCGSVCSSA